MSWFEQVLLLFEVSGKSPGLMHYLPHVDLVFLAAVKLLHSTLQQ